MSERPTPETDAQGYGDGRHPFVPTEFARKLERERDEARKQAAMWKANHDNQVSLKAMLMDRPDLGDRASRIAELIRERAEALEQFRWKSVEEELPAAWEWVLHTYKGVRLPEYGLYDRGHFFRGERQEKFSVTHWLRLPSIDKEEAK